MVGGTEFEKNWITILMGQDNWTRKIFEMSTCGLLTSSTISHVVVKEGGGVAWN